MGDLCQVPLGFAQQLGRSQHTATLLWHSLSAWPRRQYIIVCSAYQAFCLHMFGPSFCSFPASNRSLMEWIANLSCDRKTYHTVKNRFAALQSWHIDLGLNTALFKDNHIRCKLQGFKHLHGISSWGQKLPITLLVLTNLVDLLHLTAPLPVREDYVPWCFHSCLRMLPTLC